MLSYKPSKQFATRMRSLFKKISIFFRQKILWLLAIPITVLGLLLIVYHLIYWNKIYPGIYLAEIPVGNLTKKQAEQKVSVYLEKNLPHEAEITLLDGQEKYFLELTDLNLQYEATNSVQTAFNFGRKQNFWQGLRQKIQLWQNPTHFPLAYQLDQNKLLALTTVLAAQVNLSAIEPTVTIDLSNSPLSVTVFPGQTGREIKLRLLQNQLTDKIAFCEFGPMEIPFTITSPSLTENEVQSLTQRAERILGKSIELTYENLSWKLKDNNLIDFLSFETFGDGFDRFKIDQFVNLMTIEIDRAPENAIFQFHQGLVVEFQPDKPGLKLDRIQTSHLIIQALKQDQAEARINLPVDQVSAEITTADVNNLGINEQLAKGESWFRGSIANRVHNIKTATEKLNGLLIPPGKEASFNQSLGEVTAETGFKEAYVIKQGRTIPEIGGGVCQVSTTFFRAALQAGLEITERHAHAYRVGYYEQGSGPGIDATVYSPTADLKFINNTPAHILIQTTFDKTASHLVFEIYGTNDGREVEITKPIITERSSPPPPLYLPDPNLPVGTTKEVEHAIPGAKTIFYQKVFRSGELVLEDSFPSRYQAWQAVYMEGTKTP